ncbi:low affinity immunoglobulin gamma Fc region receptor III-like [Dromiciops gliroides]|uniref:low affinity immunoglobulin gamma Fc region receptor III-like n=1 Tax=Dromiciops gliroides TaxID=33562 RepID=UPI001CC55819|nr:low affinity immunoglobulin gamma Fc region receptor III-like [Dromiciops gliroides]
MPPLLLPFFLLLVLADRKEASLSKPVVTLYPPWFSVLTDDSVSLRCEGSGIPEDNSTLWLLNDRIIPVQIQDYDITNVNMMDSGKYQCQKGQSALSDPVRLDVFQDFLLLQTLKLVYTEGEPLVMRCHFWKNKTIANIVFFHNGKGVFSQCESNFSIDQVNHSHSGNYSCSAKRGNKKYESKVVRITVQGTNIDPDSSTSLSSKVGHHIPFYLVMGLLFAVNTVLYYRLNREANSLKNTRHPLKT